MAELYCVTGAAHNLGQERWVYRTGAWVRDHVAQPGDVCQTDPVDALRWAHKLEAVNPRDFPPLPGEPEHEPEPEPEPEEEPPDEIDIDLYRVGDSNWYELPNGDKVQGRDKALAVLGVTDGSD